MLALDDSIPSSDEADATPETDRYLTPTDSLFLLKKLPKNSPKTDDNEMKPSLSSSEGGSSSKMMTRRADSGHTATNNSTSTADITMAKRVKKLKTTTKPEKTMPVDCKFVPLEFTSGEQRETRRLRFADECGGDLYETTLTERIHYPPDKNMHDYNVRKPPVKSSVKSCCVVC